MKSRDGGEGNENKMERDKREKEKERKEQSASIEEKGGWACKTTPERTKGICSFHRMEWLGQVTQTESGQRTCCKQRGATRSTRSSTIGFETSWEAKENQARQSDKDAMKSWVMWKRCREQSWCG